MGELAELEKVSEVAEQAVLFAMALDHDMVDPDKTNGHQGLATIIGEEALKFYDYYQVIAANHFGGDSGLMWDAIDWYETSDLWVAEKIAHLVYKN